MIKTMQDRQPGLGTTGISGTLTLTKTGTTARTATFPDAAITVAGLEVANVFTVAQTFSAVLNKMGGGTYSADDSVLLLRRESTAIPNSHAVRDESVWTVSSGGGGYCPFDSLATYAGASAFNHLHAYQSRNSYTGSASLVDLVGFWSQESHTGSGTVTNRRGLWVKDAAGSGTITNNFGIHIEALTRGSSNLAIYSAGAAACQLNGNLILGSSYTTAGTPVLAMSSTVAGDHGFNVRNLSSGTSAYAYFSLRNDATASVLFTSYSSGYTGTGYGLTLANYTALQAFGASNLGLIIGTTGSALPVIFGTNNVVRLTIAGTGESTFASTTDATTTSDGSVRLSGGLSVAANKAIVAGGNIIMATATAASTTAGTLQRETNQDKHYAYANGIGGWVDKCIFSQYAAVTKSGAVTAQSLASATARGTRTLPANFFKVGKVIKFRLCGIYTTDVAAGNATLAITIGGTTIRTTGSFALDASVTDGYWTLDGEFTCYSTGGSGTVSGQTVWLHRQAGAGGQPAHMQEMTTTGAVTIDTTASGAFDVVWTADDAGTSITCTCFRLWEVC